MGKVFLSQFNFNEYAGARSINVRSGITVDTYLDELSTDNSNSIYLSDGGLASPYNFLISTEDEHDMIYANVNLSGMAKGLTSLENTDLLNKQRFNYYVATNMHTMFANCYSLKGKPISAGHIQSMYGTYYNDTNLKGALQVGSNVTNLIGTFYNCVNLTGPARASENVISMKRAYYNCVKLTGEPACGEKTKSLEEAYYNCYLLEGNPANCNSAIMTANAYYNCPNLYGNFYWCGKSMTDQADKLNLTNMFYQRNCDNKLNIIVRPNSGILNGLLNYSATFGNIYGTGEIIWSEQVNENGNTYYNNSLYNTNLYLLFNMVNLPPIYYSNNLELSENYYRFLNGYTVHREVDEATCFNYLMNAYFLMDIVNSSVTIPSGYEQEIIENSSDPNNFYYYFNSYVKWVNEVYYTGSYTSLKLNVFLNQKFTILQTNGEYEVNEFYLNPSLSPISAWEYEDKKAPYHKIMHKDSSAPSYFRIIQSFNDMHTTNWDGLFSGYSFTKDSLIKIDIPSYITSINHLFHITSVLNNNANGYPNAPYYFDQERYFSSIKSLWDSAMTQTNLIQTYSLFEGNLHNIYVQPTCGSNILYMASAYENCSLYQNQINIGINVINADNAFANTDCNGDTIYIPDNVITARNIFSNCQHIYDLNNLVLYNKSLISLTGAFENCRNLIDCSQIDFIDSVASWRDIFYNCVNLTTTLSSITEYVNTNAKYIDLGGMYAGCSKITDGEFYHFNSSISQDYTNISYNNMYIGCSNLINCKYLNNMNYDLMGNIKDLDLTQTFYGCSNLISDVELNGYNINLRETFYECYNIINVNINAKENLSLYGTFYNCYNLSKFKCYENTVYVTSGGSIFHNCYNLTEIFINGSANMTGYTDLFKNCFNLQYLNVTNGLIYNSYQYTNSDSLNIFTKNLSIQLSKSDYCGSNNVLIFANNIVITNISSDIYGYGAQPQPGNFIFTFYNTLHFNHMMQFSSPSYQTMNSNTKNIITNNFNYFNIIGNITFNKIPENVIFSTEINLREMDATCNFYDVVSPTGTFDYQETNCLYYLPTMPQNIFVDMLLRYEDIDGARYIRHVSNYITVNNVNISFSDTGRLHMVQDPEGYINNLNNNYHYNNLFGATTHNIYIDAHGFEYNMTLSFQNRSSISYQLLRKNYPFFGECTFDSITNSYEKVDYNALLDINTFRIYAIYKNTTRNITYQINITANDDSLSQALAYINFYA